MTNPSLNHDSSAGHHLRDGSAWLQPGKEQVQQRHYEVAVEWVQNALKREKPLLETSDWQLIAECAASEGYFNQEGVFCPELDWAHVAVLAYAYLMQEEKKSPRLLHKPVLKKNIYASYLLKLMQIQVYSILAFGVLIGDSVRDIDQLIQHFYEDLSCSPDDLRKNYEEKEMSFEYTEG